MTVPQAQAPTASQKTNALVPKPPSGPVPKLSAGRTQIARSTTATGAPQKAFQRPSGNKKSPVLKYALIGLGVAAVGAGALYGPGLVGQLQDKWNAKQDAAAKRPIGGEIGHTLDIYDTLDKTDPNRPAGSAKGLASRVRRATGPRGAGGVPVAGDSAAADNTGADGAAAAPSATGPLPIIAPVYTLDSGKMKIPESRVNGLVSGTNFLAEAARIDKFPASYALSLRQGPAISPDRAVIVYLHLGPTEGPSNRTFMVSPDLKDPAISSVAKLWKTDPKYAARNQSYSSGYALKLELGAMTNNAIAGKIYLALPDSDKTVVAGQFNAMYVVPAPGTQVAPVARTAPAANPRAAADKAAYDRRYNISR